MRNTGLDEAQAGIKIAGRNINHLRYADDNTLMAESEEELKSNIGTDAPAELPDKDRLILVYCRSGRRSKLAAEKLAALGYTRVVEIGRAHV